MSDLWRGMVSHTPHVNELKNWMPRHSKKTSVGVELKAGGDPHGSEKPGWSASDIRQWPKKKKKVPRHPVSPTGVLLLVLGLAQSHQNNY